MELLLNSPDKTLVDTEISNSKSFITANTVKSTIHELRNDHIIPVFVKDNEPVISQADFIDTTIDVIKHAFPKEKVLAPAIRLSHPIKGRIPDAKSKPADMLTEAEKTIYYERMAFAIEIPTITHMVDGNLLTLTVGGVKAYNLDNLYNKKGCHERFKVFIGFQNTVCTNMCIWSDGYVADLKVNSEMQLVDAMYNLVNNYNAEEHLQALGSLAQYSLTEIQFAQLIGKCRMYHYLPVEEKRVIPTLNYGDTQLGIVLKDYYSDASFCKSVDGTINLWKLYNLFTGANQSSYIDTFLDRSANAYSFVNSIAVALLNKGNNWFLG